LWRLLADGADAITEVPNDRWHLQSTYHPDPARPGRMNTRWGGFLDHIDRFDTQFFGISPREAALMDPQQRLLLEVSYEAAEDAGLTLASLAGKRAGVYVGISTFDYATLQLDSHGRTSIDAYTTLGGMLCIAANRISYFFNLVGPSLAVDSACSSSLVAVDLACRSIWNGQSELAFAAGVNAMLRPEPTIGAAKALMLSPDGRCKSFDVHANGFVRGEGAAVVILKPLHRAVADRDQIYALVRATAVNQDGRTEGITVPNPAAQQANMVDALRLANIAPESVHYIEAHGTGTPVGDPIEAAAVGAIYGSARKPQDHCFIGSVKSNLGHLEAGAGIVGLIKAALCVQRRQIPPSLHFGRPNPQIPFDELRLQVPQKLSPWPATDGQAARAGVNSFGAGGTNAHAILEAPPSVSDIAEPGKRTTADRAWLLPISARSPTALTDLARSYLAALPEPGGLADVGLRDICYSAGVKRSHHECRMGFVASNHADLEERLKAFVNEASSQSSSHQERGLATRPVFVCSGMGQQWWAMGRELMQLEPVYRNTMQELSDLFGELTGWSLLEKLSADEDGSEIQDIRVSQPAIFALQAALTSLWRSWGVEPAAVLGHSAGEVAASYIAGALSLDDAVRLTFHRSRLLCRTAGQGTMLAVGISCEQAVKLIEPHARAISLAAVNGPRSVTLSGDASILSDIDRQLNEAGLFSRIVQVDAPFHSSKMEQLHDELVASLHDIEPRPAAVPFFSTVTGTALSGSELDARHWYRNMRDPVLFRQVMGEIIGKGHRTFLEIGAHPVLRYDIAECLNEQSSAGTVLCSLRRGEPERSALLNSLGRLYCSGTEVEWRKLFPGDAKSIKLPLYPFQAESQWHEVEHSRRLRLDGPVHPLLGRRVEAPQPTWSVELNGSELGYLEDHRVAGAAVFPAAGYVEIAVAVAQEAFGSPACLLEHVEFPKLLELERDVARPARIVLDAGSEFKVHVRAGALSHSWDEHVHGFLRPAGRNPPAGVDIASIQQRCRDQMDREEFYALLDAAGMQYGSSFRGVAALWRGERETLATISMTDELRNDVADYRWHPAVLDACLQPVLATLPAAVLYSGTRKIFVPVKIERVHFYATAPTQILSHIRLRDLTSTELKFDIQIFDPRGVPLADMQGFICRAPRRSSQVAGSPSLYEYQWKLAPRPASHRSSSLFFSLDALVPTLMQTGQALSQRFNRARFQNEFQDRARETALAYIVQALRDLGWRPTACVQAPVKEISRQLGVAPRYDALLQLFLKEIASAGSTTEDPQRLWKSLWNDFPEYQAETILLRRCGKNLASVLRGEMDPLGLTFPDNSPISAEHFYQNSATFRPNNLMVQKAIVEIVNRLSPGKALRILEIGGGTGGMTSFVLPVLPDHRTEYVFTDVSLRFIAHAQRKFAQHAFVQYRPLDIGLDPIEQGFVAHSFDLIIASNVLHATRDLRKTLEHVRTLLASGGCLLLLEITRPWLFATLSFGLLKGWWLFEDHDLRSEGPSLSIQKWANLLCETGFSAPVSVADCPEPDSAQHAVILARGPELPAAPARPSHPSTQPKSWLIFADSGLAGHTSTGAELALQLRERRDRVIQVRHDGRSGQIDEESLTIAVDRREDWRHLLESIRDHAPHLAGIIYLWSLDIETADGIATDALKASASLGCLGAVQLVQAIAATNGLVVDSLWLVTRSMQRIENRSQELEVMQSPLWGLGRVINNEYRTCVAASSI
jgi:acyl transferase domain-containing protein